MKLVRLTMPLFVLLLVGCGMAALPTDSESQLDYACEIINGWPADYASIWPTAIQKHNAAADDVSASGYMQGYITLLANEFKISDSEPSRMVESYKQYWSVLEMDYITGGGVLPDSPISSGIVSNLMQRCDELGRGISNSN